MSKLQSGLGRLLAVGLLLGAASARAQDLEPRAYAPSPKDANFVIVNYSYQSGEVLFDPSLPFSDVRAFINGVVGGYGHTFSLFGRISSVAAVVPYVWASVDGNVGETYQAITRSGLGDPRLRFVVNLIGGPALPMKEFMARKPEPTLGFSLVAVVPTGQYSNEKLINIGTNRWAFRPEFGLSFPVGKWTLEGAAGVWLFLDNDHAYPAENVRSQDPLYSFQVHVGYTVRPGLWVAADATYYAGGKTYTNDVPGDTRQANTRAGLTASVPVARGHSVKLSASRGVDSRIGSRFNAYGLAYQYLWLSRTGK
ncbi:MAG TPA: transporter [Thermoanaerobaculia bacterium]|nr:transporter [Thermoanaerobaculia bacterium]